MEDKILRYIRQIALPEIGIIGQKKLMDSKVVLVGAGALGCPAALYLSAAGVGRIGIVDDDVVDLDNLHRQILHKTRSLGQPKTDSARSAILDMDPDIIVETYQERLNGSNAEAILKGYDLVLDGSDNFETRYIMNAACVKLGIPLVHGSVLRFTGQVSVFNCSNPPTPPFSKGGKTVVSPLCKGGQGGISPCYSCLYPRSPPAEVSPTCARAGVLGAVPGIIGTMQALEALKLLAGFGEPLIGKLLIFDGLTGRMRILEVKKDPKCEVCGLSF